VAEPTNDKDKKRMIASTAIWFVILLYIIGTALFLLFPDIFIKILSADVEIPRRTFQWAIISITLTGIFYFIGVYIRFLRMTKAVALLSFTHAILTTLLTLLFVIYYKMGVDGVYLSSIIVTPFIIIAQTIVLRKELLFKVDSKLLKPLFRYSLPLIPGAISYVILNFTDRLFIKEQSMSDAGVYAMGSKFSQLISIIILGISSALGPIVYEKHLNENTKDQLARIFRLFIAAGSVGVLTLSLFTHETLVIFTNEKYYGASPIMPILYLSVFFTGFSMFSIGLHIKERTKIIGVIVVISAMLNIALNYFLIKEFHMLGAACATLISVCFNNFTLFFISQQYYRLEFPYVKIMFAFLLLFAFMYLGSFELKKLELNLWLSILAKAGIVLLFILYLYSSKLINFMKPINHLRK
jgi:O-antigen/teichoic acid export membrane protein